MNEICRCLSNTKVCLSSMMVSSMNVSIMKVCVLSDGVCIKYEGWDLALLVDNLPGAMGSRIDFLSRPILVFFLFHPVFCDWYIKCCGIYYPVYWMMHLKDPLLSIKSMKVMCKVLREIGSSDHLISQAASL